MKKKRMAAVLVIGLLSLCSIMGYGLWERSEQAWLPQGQEMQENLGLEMLPEGMLEGKEKLKNSGNPGVCFEQVLLPYDAASNQLYLSQEVGESAWNGVLSSAAKGYTLYAAEDSYWQTKEKALQENHIFTLWLVGVKDYYEVNLVVSGMPVISMYTEYFEEPEPVAYEEDPDKFAFDSDTMYYGTIDVFNPGVGTGQYEILQAHTSYHLKGASTRGFDKKSYALSLMDYRGEKLNVPLLGMRSDNSWKLNALNTDVNRIREKTASEIWEAFDQADSGIDEAGARLEYVELVLDNEYRGLYCLVEPIDEKKLELDRNDALYKVVDWEAPTPEEIQNSIVNQWKVCYPIRVRYPKVIADYEEAWYPIQDYVGRFYHSPELDVEEAKETVNIANLSDVLMFTMVTSASDNCFKNMYYAAKVEKGREYVMWQIPWDLDYTFGNRYEYNVQNNVTFDEDVSKIYVETALTRIKDEETGAFFYDRWSAYRQDFLSTESINGLFRKNADYLAATGALSREQQKWPEAGVTDDITSLLSFQESRMTWLDSFFADWVQ